MFNREPEKGAIAREFKRHFPSLKPVHVGQSLGDAVDLRPLVEVERVYAEDMRAMRARRGKFHACQRATGEYDKPAKAVFYPAEAPAGLHRPRHFARAAPVRQEGTFDVKGRSVKACSAYATRLIANGRVGGPVVPKDGLGRSAGLGTPTSRFRPAAARRYIYSRLTPCAAPRVGGEVWTPGASASAKVGGMNWLDIHVVTPMLTSLGRGAVKSLPRHSAARARAREEDAVRALRLRPSATLV